MLPPLEVVDSKFDAEAEAVQSKARELEREEIEQGRMVLQDKPSEVVFASVDENDEEYTPSIAPVDELTETVVEQSPSKRARVSEDVGPPQVVEVDEENIVESNDIPDDTLLRDLLRRSIRYFFFSCQRASEHQTFGKWTLGGREDRKEDETWGEEEV